MIVGAAIGAASDPEQQRLITFLDRVQDVNSIGAILFRY